MKQDLQAALKRPFPPESIKTKPGQGGRKMSFVSHGLVTERLNDADPAWSSRHVATHAFTGADGALHCAGVEIELTIQGVSRVESGGPQRVVDRVEPGQRQPITTFADEIKNAYSDALKRAAMRFGVALGMWESLIDAEGDEDYADEPTRQEIRATPPARPATGATPPPPPTPFPTTNPAGINLQALHAAMQGKVEGDVHRRLGALAEAVYGIPSLRELVPAQADRLRKAMGECRNPRDGEALIALALRTNAATSTAELDAVANDIGLAGLGPGRTELLRDAFRRANEAIRLLEQVNAGKGAQ